MNFLPYILLCQLFFPFFAFYHNKISIIYQINSQLPITTNKITKLLWFFLQPFPNIINVFEVAVDKSSTIIEYSCQLRLSSHKNRFSSRRIRTNVWQRKGLQLSREFLISLFSFILRLYFSFALLHYFTDFLKQHSITLFNFRVLFFSHAMLSTSLGINICKICFFVLMRIFFWNRQINRIVLLKARLIMSFQDIWCK